MVDFSPIAHLVHPLWHGGAIHHTAEFSRAHCVQICAFLIPANLAATVQTLMMMAMERPLLQVGLMAAIAMVYATIMVIHVATWFVVGVVMVPTYVLLSFGLACCIVNIWSVRRLWKGRNVSSQLQVSHPASQPTLEFTIQ